MSGERFDEISIGDEAEIFHTITSKDVNSFAELTGDNNPLHVDDEYASQTSFKKRVVHGMLTASFISTMIGTKLPGKGSLWYEQQTRFLAPVRIGEKIRVWAKIKHKSLSQKIVVLKIIVFGEGKRKVIEGEAKVKMIQQEKKKIQTEVDKVKGCIIISGSSRGIGATIAKILSKSGFPVLINFVRDETGATNVLNEITAEGGSAAIFQADITNYKEVQNMIAKACDIFGNIYGVVNNASAFIENKSFDKLKWENFQKHIDVQLKGSFNLCHATIPHLIKNGNGNIVFISSIVADGLPPVNWVPYNIVKTGIIAFSKSLATEYGHKGIRVNCVSPGMTMTDFIADIPEKAKMIAKMQTPLRRLAEPLDIANTVDFLFSNKSGFITGQNIRVCGGIVME